jgi:hypothetical protein
MLAPQISRKASQRSVRRFALAQSRPEKAAPGWMLTLTSFR